MLPSDIPTVSFVSPSAGVVSGTVAIEATATDNTAVANVVFKLDGVDLAPPDSTAPYTLPWNTTVWPTVHTPSQPKRATPPTTSARQRSPSPIQNGIVIGDGPHYVVFDGIDDYVVVADTPAASFGTGTADTPFTMEMWMRPDDVSVHHQLIGKAGETGSLIVYGTLMVDLRDESAGASAGAHRRQPVGAGWRVASPGRHLRWPGRGDRGERHHDLYRRPAPCRWRGHGRGLRRDGEPDVAGDDRPRRRRRESVSTAGSTRSGCGTSRAPLSEIQAAHGYRARAAAKLA